MNFLQTEANSPPLNLDRLWLVLTKTIWWKQLCASSESRPQEGASVLSLRKLPVKCVHIHAHLPDAERSKA